MPRCGSGKLSRYGDLMVRSAAGCGDLGRAERQVTSRGCWMATVRGRILG